MPLTEKISFKVPLKKRSRIQIPIHYLWQYKIETSQILKATVNVAGQWSKRESFLTKMRKDGRVAIPKNTKTNLEHNRENIEGCDLEIQLEPDIAKVEFHFHFPLHYPNLSLPAYFFNSHG